MFCPLLPFSALLNLWHRCAAPDASGRYPRKQDSALRTPLPRRAERRQASCLLGVGSPAFLPPHESARWDSKILNPECVNIVLDKTFLKVLVCGTGTFPLWFPCCHVHHTPVEGWCAWGFHGFNHVQKAPRTKIASEGVQDPSSEAPQVISALQCWPSCGH